MQSFRDKTIACTPEERGKILISIKELKSQSDISAESSQAQTVCPPRDADDLDHHFVGFVSSKGHLFELDGTKYSPIDHGTTSPKTFADDVWHIIKSNFIDLDPDVIGFSLLALIRQE